jgi:hypothetical protein
MTHATSTVGMATNIPSTYAKYLLPAGRKQRSNLQCSNNISLAVTEHTAQTMKRTAKNAVVKQEMQLLYGSMNPS